jgi:hypothetical protein
MKEFQVSEVALAESAFQMRVTEISVIFFLGHRVTIDRPVLTLLYTVYKGLRSL